MKSKVLSLVLVLTVLCSILSVSTVSFADASKGDEIAPATLKASISYGATNSSNLGGVTRTTFEDRGEVAGLVTSNGLTPGGSAANGIAGFKVVPAGLDLSKPFTFEFEYYAKTGVWAELNFGGKDVFIANGTGVFINTRNAFNTTDSTAATAAPETWHKVLVNYDGANYRVYLNGVLLKNPDGTSAFAPASTISNLIIGFYGAMALPNTDSGASGDVRLYVDNVYAYAKAYDPDGNPLVEEDVITISASASAATVTASVTLSDTYATGDYCFWLATYDSNNGKELIGVTSVDITEAGFYDLKVTFKDTDAFSAVDYAKAFVWDKNTLEPTAVKALLGSEPQN